MTSVKSSEILSDILFIDQGAPSDFNGKYMGLMIKDANGNALDKLPAGNYTVMIGSDKTAAIQAVKFTVGDDYATLTGKFGDINGDTSIDTGDSTALLNALVAGGSNKPGNCAYTLGTKLAIKDSTVTLVWGDLNGDKSVDTGDSTALLNALVANGATKVGDSAYSFGDDLSLTVKVVTENN